MKTNVSYALYLTLALFVLNLALYFTGMHSDAAKFATADTISKCCFWIFAAIFIALGTRARRAETPLNVNFGYGQAFLSGFMISLFTALFSIVTNVVYSKVINPGFIEVIIQAATEKAEAKGLSSTQIEGMEKGIRMMSNPFISSIFVFFIVLVLCTLVALITSIFIRRPAQDDLAPPAIPGTA